MTNLELRRAARAAMRYLHQLEKYKGDDNVCNVARLALVEVAKLQCSIPPPIKCEWDCANARKKSRKCPPDNFGHFTDTTIESK